MSTTATAIPTAADYFTATAPVEVKEPTGDRRFITTVYPVLTSNGERVVVETDFTHAKKYRTRVVRERVQGIMTTRGFSIAGRKYGPVDPTFDIAEHAPTSASGRPSPYSEKRLREQHAHAMANLAELLTVADVPGEFVSPSIRLYS